MLKNAFSEMPQQAPPRGIGEEIFREHMRGTLSPVEYHGMTIAFVSDTIQAHRPGFFIAIPDQLADYIRSRLAGHMDEDASYGRKLGLWICTVVKQREDNQADLAMLRWAAERARLAGNLTGPLETIERAIAQHDAARFPPEFEDAIRVQKMDARAREGRERGRG